MAGTLGYYSDLIVRKDSVVKTFADVFKSGKSLSFGNGDPALHTRLFRAWLLRVCQNKIDAKAFFKVTRGANHETNALAVANKQGDVATVSSEVLEKIKERQKNKFNGIRIIWASPLIPLDPLVMRNDLPPSGVSLSVQARKCLAPRCSGVLSLVASAA